MPRRVRYKTYETSLLAAFDHVEGILHMLFCGF